MNPKQLVQSSIQEILSRDDVEALKQALLNGYQLENQESTIWGKATPLSLSAFYNATNCLRYLQVIGAEDLERDKAQPVLFACSSGALEAFHLLKDTLLNQACWFDPAYFLYRTSIGGNLVIFAELVKLFVRKGMVFIFDFISQYHNLITGEIFEVILPFISPQKNQKLFFKTCIKSQNEHLQRFVIENEEYVPIGKDLLKSFTMVVVYAPNFLEYFISAYNPDINEQDKYGWTPLMYAIDARLKTSIEILLAAGADPKIAAKTGWTAGRAVLKSNDASQAVFGDDTPILQHFKADFDGLMNYFNSIFQNNPRS